MVFSLHHCYRKTARRSQPETPADENNQSKVLWILGKCFTFVSLFLCSVLPLSWLLYLCITHSLICSFPFFSPFLFSHPYFTICFLFIWFLSNSTLQKREEEHLWSKHPNFAVIPVNLIAYALYLVPYPIYIWSTSISSCVVQTLPTTLCLYKDASYIFCSYPALK